MLESLAQRRKYHAMTPDTVISTYNAVGQHFAGERRGLPERKWLDRFFHILPRHDAAGRIERRVLDVGCGAGRPIASYLIDRGAKLTGLDASQTMLDLFQAHLPKARALHLDMRKLALNEEFDGLIAWDSFFHLSPDDQRSTLPRFGAHLAPHGLLLFTSGPEAGVAIGEIQGHSLYHASLSPDEYHSLLDASGLDVLTFAPEDPETGNHSVWLARKRPE